MMGSLKSQGFILEQNSLSKNLIFNNIKVSSQISGERKTDTINGAGKMIILKNEQIKDNCAFLDKNIRKIYQNTRNSYLYVVRGQVIVIVYNAEMIF